MNAMALAHDEFAASWSTGPLTTIATIPPAIVITYVGTGAPYYKRLQETAAATFERDQAQQRRQHPVVALSVERKPGESVTTGQVGDIPAGPIPTFKRPKGVVGKPLLKHSSYEVSSYLCPIGAKPRTVIAERPRETSDFVCKVRYLKQGGLTTPWITRNDTTFCATKAAELAKKLSMASSYLYRGP